MRLKNKKCALCGKNSSVISELLAVCYECITSRFELSRQYIENAHKLSRGKFNLPFARVYNSHGIQCRICLHNCSVENGKAGYCGLPIGNRLNARVSWYFDPLPTNCVADFVCPARTGCGYPEFAYKPGTEYGYKNLAVFYEACTFDCLYCQNWHYRISDTSPSTADDIVEAIDKSTACICFFGGDPTPYIVHSLNTAKLAISKTRGRILRICWETNGSMDSKFLEKMIEIALETGGCIKFDLKAWTESIHIALTGVSNKQTLQNFKLASSHINKRPQVPLLVASTLLVPGYVDADEVYQIAKFIASLNREIPYSLLAFHPDFLMIDLPPTSLAHSERCFNAAREAGLKRVHIGNKHLLWRGDYS